MKNYLSELCDLRVSAVKPLSLLWLRQRLAVLFVVNVLFLIPPESPKRWTRFVSAWALSARAIARFGWPRSAGFFKKHGLDVEAIFIGGGAARGINALLAGDIQFASASGGPVISSMLKGSDVMMIAALNNKGVHRLLVRPDIDTPEALKGKRIAITAFGTASHTVLTLLLNHWNLRQEELNVLQIGSSPTMLVSLQKKIVDGAA